MSVYKDFQKQYLKISNKNETKNEQFPPRRLVNLLPI